jgi:hypothetical protein
MDRSPRYIPAPSMSAVPLPQQLTVIALHATMPFAFAACPIASANARIGAIDWNRMMPVLLPVAAGAAVVGALVAAVANRSDSGRTRIACAIATGIANPLLSSMLGGIFAAILSVVSLGHIANVSLYWSAMWLPLSMAEAPFWTLATCALLALATAALVARPWHATNVEASPRP